MALKCQGLTSSKVKDLILSNPTGAAMRLSGLVVVVCLSTLQTAQLVMVGVAVDEILTSAAATRLVTKE